MLICLAGSMERLITSPVGSSTVNQCASALKSLYDSQVAVGSAPPDKNPRGPAIAIIIEGLKKVAARRDRLACKDKGISESSVRAVRAASASRADFQTPSMTASREPIRFGKATALSSGSTPRSAYAD